MVDTVVKVSNSQLSKNPDYKVLVEDILGSNSQVVRLNVGAPGAIQYWDGSTTSSIINNVTVDAGQSWVEALYVGDSILSNTSAMLALVDDGTSHAAALVQPTTPADTQPISAASLPLPSGAATEATLAKLNGFSVPVFDYISLGYTGANLTSVVYKSGGAGGSTVRTLTLAYSGSTLTSVTAS